MGIGVWLNYVDPAGAFTYITAFATVAGVWTWGVILARHIRYRAAVRAGRAAPAWFTAPGGAAASWAALAFLASWLVLIGADADARVSLYGVAGLVRRPRRSATRCSSGATRPPSPAARTSPPRRAERPGRRAGTAGAAPRRHRARADRRLPVTAGPPVTFPAC